MARSTGPQSTRRRFLVAAGGIAGATTPAGCISRPRRDGPDGGSDEPSNAGPSAGRDGNADAAVSGWSQFGRDAGNTGHAPGTTGPATDPTIRWRFDAGTPTMNTSPVVVDGTVYVAGSGDPGYVYAVDADTGESEWQFEPAGYATSAPAVVDGVLYVGTWGRRLYAIDATTGEERWSTDVGHRFGPSSPAVVDGTVYVGTIGDGPLVVSGPEDEESFEAGALLAVDAETGDERWRYDAFGEKEDVASSPAVVDGRVYFGGEHAVYALDAASGEAVWRRDIATHSEASPTVAGGVVYYGAPLGSAGEHPARVWALDAATGETRWSAGIDDASLRTSPAVADGTVYVPASSMRVCDGVGGDDGSNCSGVTRGRLYAVDAASGERRWHAPIETDTRSSPAVAGDVVYVGCRNGISAVTTAGEPAWRVDFEGDRGDGPYVKSSPAVADGVVYVGASDGRLRAIAE